MNVRQVLPRLILLIGVIAAIIWAALNRDRLDLAALDAWLSGLGFVAPLAYLGLYAVGTIAFLPGALFALAGGALFGPVWGSLLNLVGATIGASLAFLIARYLAGGWVAARTGGRLKRLIEGVEAEGWRFVAFVRLVPLFPFNLTNYALGLTRINFWSYVITSLIAMAPGAIAYTWLGHAGREAFSGDASAIRYGLLALGLLAAIALLPQLIRRMRGEKHRWIDADTLAHKLRKDGVTVVDVRGPDEFEGALGHIASALNLPLGELPERLTEIRASRDRSVILVCKTDKRSAAAVTLLSDAGFRDVSVLRGGMEQWNRDGKPVEISNRERTGPNR
ncbi:VTT domain-containing protein [Mesorhizobium sp. J428]|uniref:VTT domain-containing protein n=1 Tax=Mesorhizobium sp. J428 TaxID=2898440 RepID=UPI002151FC14|nr:VTT domain-containing protein [Mesorhizobium sp. J428]MCR5857399.1 VTT domain-containing protein [Mesorhizobium sp. J428]